MSFSSRLQGWGVWKVVEKDGARRGMLVDWPSKGITRQGQQQEEEKMGEWARLLQSRLSGTHTSGRMKMTPSKGLARLRSSTTAAKCCSECNARMWFLRES